MTKVLNKRINQKLESIFAVEVLKSHDEWKICDEVGKNRVNELLDASHGEFLEFIQNDGYLKNEF